MIRKRIGVATGNQGVVPKPGKCRRSLFFGETEVENFGSRLVECSVDLQILENCGDRLKSINSSLRSAQTDIQSEEPDVGAHIEHTGILLNRNPMPCVTLMSENFLIQEIGLRLVLETHLHAIW